MVNGWLGLGALTVVALGPLTCLEDDEPSNASARASQVWTQDCAGCHGQTGNADTPMAARLSPPPPNFRDPCTPVTSEWIERVVISGGASYGGAAAMRPHHELKHDKDVLEALVTLVQGLRDEGECREEASVAPIESPP